MPDVSALSGQLRVRVSWSEGRVRAVDVDLQRPLTSLGHLWLGREPAEVLSLLPLVFSVCSLAQQLASVQALEAASGWQVDPEISRWRQQAVRLEALREALLVIQPFWQPALPEKSLYPLLRACQQTLNSLQPLMAFQAQTLDEQPELPEELTEFRSKIWPQWLETSLPVSQNWPDVVLAPAACDSLEEEDLPHLLAQLRRGDTQPSLAGHPRITGPVGASRATAAQELLRERHQGLRNQVSCFLNELTQEPAEENGQVTLPQTATGEGWSRVMTARGWLFHRVVLQQGRVANYQLLAPTDWNLHPQGLLYQQLKNLRIDREALPSLVEALVASSFPCVEAKVEIEDA
ncbi:nickel-dependent hydrogenase large subunit [Marinospirillum sp.]|uniref:nickel-dependent hydrogenase large subunit n=1 Tax=Marinospirillum sp. TaxID=2183934 RepID=UPI00286FB007|nr:nickel-dependent hydrogenase large subunit [Marinospirillum sp.]MDR9468652.1 nickel-dependent hydrogenase large subunit [Marinospirillum sp.]